MRQDNWKHKAACMRCLTCGFFVPKGSGSLAALDEPALGRCRRHAPTLNGWPAVFEGDWCGDHKLDENKLDAYRSLQRKEPEIMQGPAGIVRIPGQERKSERE